MKNSSNNQNKNNHNPPYNQKGTVNPTTPEERERKWLMFRKYFAINFKSWRKLGRFLLLILLWATIAFFAIGGIGVVAKNHLTPIMQIAFSDVEGYTVSNAVTNTLNLLFVLALPLIIAGIGRPKNSGKSNRKVAKALGLYRGRKDWHERPFLISNTPASHNDKRYNNKHIRDFVFWSEWFDIKKWDNEDFLDEFCHSMALNRQKVFVVQGGKGGKEITIRAIKNDKVGLVPMSEITIFNDDK